MKKLQKIGYMVLGATLAITIFTAAPTFAASVQKQLTAYYNGIKIYVDGALITPKDATGKVVDPFVSDGTTYLPVRAVGEALGKTVDWDGATQSVYIGAKPGTVQYMTDILPAYQVRSKGAYHEFSNLNSGGIDSFKMGGVKYLNGITIGGYDSQQEWAVYNLNGQYTSFNGVICHVDDTATVELAAKPPTLQIILDGVLKTEYDLSSDMAPQDISVDVTGALQMKLILTNHNGAWYGVGNPILK